jgi:FKBP-type peptidyl-prolyl cis-trans isomerase
MRRLPIVLVAIGLAGSACGKRGPAASPTVAASSQSMLAASSHSMLAASSQSHAEVAPSGGTLLFFGRIIGSEIAVGGGRELAAGQRVRLSFTMALTDGRVVASSAPAGHQVDIGNGELLPGWERAMLAASDERKQALPPMREGGQRQINLPGEWAFAHPDCRWPLPAGVARHDSIIIHVKLEEILGP